MRMEREHGGSRSDLEGPTADEQREHLRFLEAYYSKVHRVYDATRKYFLFGRDRLLEEIAEDHPEIVIEVGCGTGRNLRKLQRMLPGARFGAIEPCPSMREHAMRKIPGLRITPECAEDADLGALFSAKPDAILLSYTLSMMREPARALRNCVEALAPGGRVYAVDFGNGQGFGRLGRKLLLGGLGAFHVHPDTLDSLFDQAADREDGPLGYWRRGIFTAGA
jgi:S-adenosylmethionine-diacylgycerolhomoserine-N-methlytransferase